MFKSTNLQIPSGIFFYAYRVRKITKQMNGLFFDLFRLCKKQRRRITQKNVFETAFNLQGIFIKSGWIFIKITFQILSSIFV